MSNREALGLQYDSAWILTQGGHSTTNLPETWLQTLQLPSLPKWNDDLDVKWIIGVGTCRNEAHRLTDLTSDPHANFTLYKALKPIRELKQAGWSSGACSVSHHLGSKNQLPFSYNSIFINRTFVLYEIYN